MTSILTFLCQLEFVVERYQTLLTGIIAIAIAVPQIKLMRSQIRQDHRDRLQARYRMLHAAIKLVDDFMERVDRAPRPGHAGPLTEDYYATMAEHLKMLKDRTDAFKANITLLNLSPDERASVDAVIADLDRGMQACSENMPLLLAKSDADLMEAYFWGSEQPCGYLDARLGDDLRKLFEGFQNGAVEDILADR